MSQRMEIGFLVQFGHRGFGFIETLNGQGDARRFFCHVTKFRRPKPQDEQVVFLGPEEIDPAGTLVNQLEELAGQRTPVAFIPGQNDRGPEAEFWCVAKKLQTAEYEVIAHLTREARERQDKLVALRQEFAETARESDELLRLTPTSWEDALARGWRVRQDQGNQVVMVTPGPGGKLISRTFSKNKGVVSSATPPALKFRRSG